MTLVAVVTALLPKPPPPGSRTGVFVFADTHVCVCTRVCFCVSMCVHRMGACVHVCMRLAYAWLICFVLWVKGCASGYDIHHS